MNVSDLLTPWLMLIAVLAPLVYIERWIHSHLYGVGWLLTNDEKSATILYYVLLFPGVLLHELVQWLVAGAMGVRTKTIRIWPEPQQDGTLRLDFVQLQHPNKISAAIIGAAPLAVGLAVVWAISNYVLQLDHLLDALGTSDLPTVAAAIADLASTPDFYLWLYLLFAVSNAMLPTAAEREGWVLILAIITVVVSFLILIGTGEQLLATYETTIIAGVERLITAFGTVLVVELPAMIVIGFGEEVLERTTGRKFQYVPPDVAKPREPGSSAPLPPGEPKPSLYLLDLPVPLPPDRPKPQRADPAPRTGTPERRPSLAPSSVAETRSAEAQAEAPTLRPGPDERVKPDDAPQRPRPTTPPQTTETRAAGRPVRPGETPDRVRGQEQRPSETIGETRSAGSRDPGLRRSPTSDRDSRTDRPSPTPRTPRQDVPEQTERFRRPDTDRSSPGPRSTPTSKTSPPAESMSRDRRRETPGDAPEHTSPPDRPGRTAPRTPPVRPQFERTRPTPDEQRRRPPADRQRPASPFVEDETHAEDDDLEYVPFDDIDLPPDDDF